MEFKPKMQYTVRATRAPGELTDSYVPTLVERLQPVELESVVEKCMDRGLIAGIKPTMAQSIAEGICEQMAHEFKQGLGILFGNYFYGRPYLSGTVHGNGELTGDNEINIRMYKGEGFALDRNSFSLSYAEGGDNPKIDSVVCDADFPRGTIQKGTNVTINGSLLCKDGETASVRFSAAGHPDVTVAQSAFTTAGANLVVFSCPAALEAGVKYGIVFVRTDGEGLGHESAPKAVKVVAAPAPQGPVITAVWSDYAGELPEGYDEDATIVEDMPNNVRGANLDGATVRLVSSGGASDTLTYDPDMSSEGVWAFQPTSGNFTNPCTLTVTTSAGTVNFPVKYYKPE